MCLLKSCSSTRHGGTGSRSLSSANRLPTSISCLQHLQKPCDLAISNQLQSSFWKPMSGRWRYILQMIMTDILYIQPKIRHATCQPQHDLIVLQDANQHNWIPLALLLPETEAEMSMPKVTHRPRLRRTQQPLLHSYTNRMWFRPTPKQSLVNQIHPETQPPDQHAVGPRGRSASVHG